MDQVQIQISKTQRELLHLATCEGFGRAMAARLNVNAHIGDFFEWAPTQMELIGEIQHRLGILGQRDSREQISADCADMANMLMRYNQLYGQ